MATTNIGATREYSLVNEPIQSMEEMWFLAVPYQNRVPTIKQQRSVWSHVSYLPFKFRMRLRCHQITRINVADNRKWYHAQLLPCCLGQDFADIVFSALLKLDFLQNTRFIRSAFWRCFCINFRNWFQTANDVRLVAAYYHSANSK